MKKFRWIIFLKFIIFCLIINSSQSIAKGYEEVFFTCADESGPLFKFSVPKFNKSSKKKEILLILFEFKNRNSSYEVQALIEKKSSPIDTSYFFYAVNFPPTNKLVEGYFEFFPPSHLLLKKGNHQFDNLACWK